MSSDPDRSDHSLVGWSRARGVELFCLNELTKFTTDAIHTHLGSCSFFGEKYSRDQVNKDPDNFFNIRMHTCPAAEMATDCKVLYVEQRFYMGKPCSKELKCDVELSAYAIRDVEEYENFCDRPTDQPPLPEEVIRG